MVAGNASYTGENETIVGNRAATTVGALILSMVFLLGFPGNLFIVWSVLARARKHSVTTLLILNLAFADGSLMGLTPFFIAYLVLKNWVFGNVMCKVLFYLCLLNMYASIYIIALMSVYRLLAVLWPQRLSRLTGRKTVMRVLLVLWLLVMVASIPAMMFRRVEKRNNTSVCDSFHDHDNHVSGRGKPRPLPLLDQTSVPASEQRQSCHNGLNSLHQARSNNELWPRALKLAPSLYKRVTTWVPLPSCASPE